MQQIWIKSKPHQYVEKRGKFASLDGITNLPLFSSDLCILSDLHRSDWPTFTEAETQAEWIKKFHLLVCWLDFIS
jgi:hypothetical protein